MSNQNVLRRWNPLYLSLQLGKSKNQPLATTLALSLIAASIAVFTPLQSIAQVAPPTSVAPITPPNSTILPTDVLPLPSIQNRMTFGENFQLRVLQKLPARFYMNLSTEASFRLETNPFQFPAKRDLFRKLGGPLTYQQLSLPQQYSFLQTLREANRQDMVFRVLPNITAGFALTPHTRVYSNYFMIRDSLFHNIRLNTIIMSVSGGVQHDFPIGNRANVMADFQFRELYQSHQPHVFDYLPGLTFTYVATPRTITFVNALMQLRSRTDFVAPKRELDPFYTAGLMHTHGRWIFSASTTFVQNFRDPFHQASIRQNNYAMISDFEVARRVVPQMPGLVAFCRAEPIWNMHSHDRPGLAGMDFRLFWGLRFQAAKPALTSALDSLRKQLEEQEVMPPQPVKAPKPSAYIRPEQVTASQPQPIHGELGETAGTVALEPVRLEDRTNVVMPVALRSTQSEETSATHGTDVASTQATDNNNDASIPQLRLQPIDGLRIGPASFVPSRSDEEETVSASAAEPQPALRMFIHNASGQWSN